MGDMMSEKKVMQMAKSNCTITCSRCGEQFNSKYGIMDGEVYCPKCYNLYVEKQIADIREISQIRINRTILRVICFVIAVALLVLSIVFKDKDESTTLFVIAIISCVLIAVFPFYKDFIAFITKGFNGFVKEEATIVRRKVIYYKNGIIDDEETGPLRILFYLIDFMLVWPCLALLVICVIPRALIDLVRIKVSSKKMNDLFNQMLPPVDGKANDKYNFDIKFVDSFSNICIEYYMNLMNVNREQAIKALQKNLIVHFKQEVDYLTGYRAFVPYYYGRRNYDGERFVFFEVSIVDKENSIFAEKPKKRRNK